MLVKINKYMELQQNYKIEKIISRINILWMIIIVISIISLYSSMDSNQVQYYRFGPNSNLIIFGISINTYIKYIISMIYLCINCFIRTLNHNILTPWIINSVQDITIKKHNNIHFIAYEINYVITIYSWIDFYIYINILLAQVDMLLIEILCNVFISGFITKYYLNHSGVIENQTIENTEKK